MFKIFKYMDWKEWLMLFLTLAIVCVQVWCNVSIPKCTLEISNYLLMPDIGAYWKEIVLACMKMLGFAVGVLISAVTASYFASMVVTSLLAKVRGKIFEKVNAFSSEEVNKFSIPSLITRSTNDVSSLQQILTIMLTMGIGAPLMAVFAIVNIVSLSKNYSVSNLSWINVISVIAIALIVFVIVFAVVPKFKTIQSYTDKLSSVTREGLTGIKVIRACGAEEQQEAKFENVNKKYSKLDLFVNKVTSIIDPGLSLVMSLTSLAIVWAVGLLSGHDPALLAIMSTFTQYSLYIITAFTSLSMIFVLLPRGIVSGKRINEVLDNKISLTDGKGIVEIEQDQRGKIKFENVSFRYPGADAEVLENISFEANAGQTIAFIGSTGSGKSTLINLIPRFYDCTSGQIFINGKNIKDYKLEQLHDLIGYVPQKGVLFSGTVKENIKYGKLDATDDEVKEAIDISGSKFVYDFPEGIEHRISQGGKNVSGGQKQRLSIARAIIRNPDFLIFDDSFSALDYKTDKTVRRKINKKFSSTTKLIVAQRIGTIMNSDKIIVLDEGKIVGMGKHKELLKNCEVYKQIALSQLTEEELSK